MRVLLYTIIPSAWQDQPIARMGRAVWRNRLGRARDHALWAVTGRWRGDYSTHEDFAHTNRGDIAVRESVRAQLSRVLHDFDPVIEEVPWEKLDARSDADLVVLCGGGFFFPDDHGLLPAEFAADVAAIEGFRCPVIGASLGLNADLSRLPTPLVSHTQVDLLRRFTGALTMLSVRDRITQAAFRPYAHTLPAVADPALFLNNDRARREATPANERTLTIGLNLAFHGRSMSRLQALTLPTLVTSLRTLAATYPCRFVYFVHSSGEMAMARALKTAGIACEVVAGPLETLQDAYAQLDVHIGQMLHSSIMACAQGTPAVGLAYDIKSMGFFDMIGQPGLCLNMWTAQASEIVTVVQHAITDRHELRLAIRKQVMDLRTQNDFFYEGLAELARAGRRGAPRARAS